MIMWNEIYQDDMDFIASYETIAWEKLFNKTILVTGATGLIGSTLINALIYANNKKSLNLKIVALVRSITKARKLFKEDKNLQFVIGSVEDLPKIDVPIDFIVHGASPTASTFFVEHPVETINTAVIGTMNLLKLAVEKRVLGFTYLSSMEVYGAPHADDIIYENQGTTIDTMSVRSCYPEAKRLCESLCASYASEYKLPATAIRLAQTFGPGVSKDDNRVFAEFVRCAMQGQDIVLQTAGTSKRCYLYTADAVTAILTVLLNGEAGEVYNAANKATYCSIVEMAQLVAEKLAKKEIKIHVPNNGKHEQKFSPPHNLNLGTEKIEKLGWIASKDLLEMYERMMKSMK